MPLKIIDLHKIIKINSLLIVGYNINDRINYCVKCFLQPNIYSTD